MMEKRLFILIIIAILLSGTAHSYNATEREKAKIDSKVLEKLNTEEMVRVVILLKEDSELNRIKEGSLDAKKINLKREKIREIQNRVLSRVSKKNFRLKQRYSSINALSGAVSSRGIEELKNNPNIEKIYLDKRAYALLNESVALIEGNKIWDKKYTGKGETACIVDTGVDYTHPDIGNPACGINISGNEVALGTPIESSHNYPNDYNNTWTITYPGFTEIAVHFERIGIEKDYWDYIQILDSNDTVVQEIFSNKKWNSSNFCEDIYGLWSASVPGDTIKIRLVADSQYNCWGFKIDKVLNGTASKWSNCGKVLGGYDFVNKDNDPMDDNGHGTHVAGIVASKNPVYKGVAPDANIVIAKVLDSSGKGYFGDVAAGVDWCTVNKDKYNISVISMSLGDGGSYSNPGTECDPLLAGKAINNAFNKGIFVSVASGNDGYTDGISYPACVSGAVSVGAVYDKNVGVSSGAACTDSITFADKITCFTNRHGILDLLAPGALITSTVPGGGFSTLKGTSMAAPHVSGLVLLMLQANRTLSPASIRDAMKNTGVSIYDSVTGLSFPRINASAAINAVAQPLQVPEFIEITLSNIPVDFGNMNPGSIQNALNNPLIASVNSNINFDLTSKSNSSAFECIGGACSGESFNVSNLRWSVNGTLPWTSYEVNETLIYSNKSSGNFTIYHQLTIPYSQKPGNYIADIIITAKKHA